VDFLQRVLFRRPRLLNYCHRFRLADATTQTTDEELDALSTYAAGCRCALEIGTYQGVSAARIAAALEKDGRLYCVDPWIEQNGRKNTCLSICQRHLSRAGVDHKISLIPGFSGDVQDEIPATLDFAFVDGDHSWSGIDTDWKIILARVQRGGIVCLHDSFVPPGQEWRRFDSSRYFQDVIAPDPGFRVIHQVYSLAILKRL
jgi:predicted O-methyltransferase YrrM